MRDDAPNWRDDYESDGAAGLGAPPAVDDVQRVEAERLDEGPRYHFGRRAQDDRAGGSGSFGNDARMAPSLLRPPVLSTWICLGLSWLFLGSRLPFTVFLGLPLTLVAVLLAAICLSRGGLITGLLVTLLGTAGSFVVYIVGLFRFFIRF